MVPPGILGPLPALILLLAQQPCDAQTGGGAPPKKVHTKLCSISSVRSPSPLHSLPGEEKEEVLRKLNDDIAFEFPRSRTLR